LCCARALGEAGTRVVVADTFGDDPREHANLIA
jgi:hypothetical protein